MMVGRLLSYWEGNFSGAMWNLGRVFWYQKSLDFRDLRSPGATYLVRRGSFWKFRRSCRWFCAWWRRVGPLRLFEAWFVGNREVIWNFQVDGCYSCCSWGGGCCIFFWVGGNLKTKTKPNQTTPNLTNPTKQLGVLLFIFSALEAKMAQFSLGAILPKVVIVKQCNICYAIYGPSGLPLMVVQLESFFPHFFFTKKIARFQGTRDLFC